MPSIPIPIRGAKEPVDSGRPYLKPSTKEKREEKQKPKNVKAERREKASAKKRVRQEKSGKNSPQDMVPGHMGTQYHQNTSQKIFQVKGGTFRIKCLPSEVLY